MYLVGTFDRDYYDLTDNSNPMCLVGLKLEITREILQKVAQDDDYQVINLLTQEYFDPKQNIWIKIQMF